MAQIPTAGLLAHWDFNGSAFDVSGNNRHGTINNVTLTAGKAGLPNTAMFFKGFGNSCVTVPYDAGLNVTALSICVTFFATAHNKSTCQGNRLFERFGVNGVYFFEFTDNTFDSSCSSYDTNRYCLQGTYNNNASPWWSAWQTTNTIHTGTWYCAVMTYNGSAYKIYLNGTLIKTVTIPMGTLGSSTNGIVIGKNNGGTYYFTGIMDDMALYNRALTDPEVAAYCNAVYQVPDTAVSISNPIAKTSICPGDTIHISYHVTNPFKTGNNFTAQLSDASGSFTSPVNIGTVSATTDGVLVATIPPGTPFGTGYRVRIVASDPVKTSSDNGVNLTISSFLAISLGDDTALCNNPDGIILDPHYPGGSYLWQNGSTSNTYNAKQTGKYYVYVTSPHGCFGSDTVNVTTRFTNVELGADTIFCSGRPLIISVPDTFDTYNWNTGKASNSITVTEGGKYWISVNKAGCANSDTINVAAYDPYFDLGDDTTLCLDETMTLIGKSIVGSSYTWQDGSVFDNYHVRQPGIYSVTASNLCGVFSDTLKVDYEDCVCNPVVPSAFTPNGDGLNDDIAPIINCRVDDYRFVVVNRWGNTVFDSKVHGKKWDGTYKGKLQEVGAYFYYMRLTGPQKKQYFLKGDIILLR